MAALVEGIEGGEVRGRDAAERGARAAALGDLGVSVGGLGRGVGGEGGVGLGSAAGEDVKGGVD